MSACSPVASKAKEARAKLRRQIADRDREIERLRAENDALHAQVAALLARVADLEEKLRANSSNSGRPPSSDPPGAPRPPRKKPTGRRPGGQPGHKGSTRALLPPEQVDHFNDYRPSHCGRCGTKLAGSDPDPLRQQFIEVPPIKPEVTENRLHSLDCPCCGATTRAELPSGVPQGAFGPRVQALAGVLSGCYRLSKRNVEQIMSDFFDVDISLGSIKAREDATSDALLQPFEEAKQHIRVQPNVHADETGWRQKANEQENVETQKADDQKKPGEKAVDDAKRRTDEQKKTRAWLWVAATPLMALFLIRRSRGAQSAKELIGETYGGTVNSDRWSGYNWISLLLRQICWAHLKRDFTKIAERGGDARRIGEALLACEKGLFELWYRVRDGTLKRSSFRTYVSPIRAQVRNLLSQGAALADSKVAGMCSKILEVEPALWTFVRVPGLEPTNNAAERALRPAVIWRRTSFGTQSDSGSAFVERMLTVVTSLRLQGRNVLEFVTAACTAALEGRNPPSLIPQKLATSDPR